MVEFPGIRGLDEPIPIDTSEGRRAYLIVGSNGRYIKLSASAYTLLRAVRAGNSFHTLAQQLSERQARPVTPAEIEAAYQRVAAQIAQIAEKPSRNPPGFWLRWTLLPSTLVVRLARPLALAFHPLVAGGLIAALLTTMLVWLQHLTVPDLFPGETPFLAIFGMLLLSVLVHELGHASACVRYGAPPREIGFALYWIFPVMYTNINAVWTLPRWQRVVVDLAGLYFQFIVAMLYAAIFLATGWEPARSAVSLILSTALLSLNPILKFDGYWLVSDLLGVVNLWDQPARIARYLRNRLWRRPVAPLPWPNWVTVVVFLYTVISVGFWLSFVRVVAQVVLAISQNYPFVVVWALGGLINPPHQLMLDRIIFLLFPTFTLLASLITIVRAAQFLLRYARTLLARGARAWRRTPGAAS